MHKLNPFNFIVYVISFLYTIYAETCILIFRLWRIVAMVLLAWILLTVFLPGINFVEHLTMLFNMVVIDPAFFLFDFFVEAAETVRLEYLIPEDSTIKITFYMLAWLSLVGLSLIILPAIWFMWVVQTYFGFMGLLSGEALEIFMSASNGMSNTAGGRNIQHLIMGRTSFEEVYDADVKANAIVEALNK